MRCVIINSQKYSCQVAIIDKKGKILEKFKVPVEGEGFKVLLHKLKPSDLFLIEKATNAFQIYNIISKVVNQVTISNPIRI